MATTSSPRSRDPWTVFAKARGLRFVAPSPKGSIRAELLPSFALRPRKVATPDDPELEQRFVIRARAPADAGPLPHPRALLGEELRAALLRFPEALFLTCDAGEARLLWEGVERDEVTLGLGADVVVAACRFRSGAGYR